MNDQSLLDWWFSGSFFDSIQWNITFLRNEFNNEESKTKCTPTKLNQVIYFKGKEEKNREDLPVADKEVNMSELQFGPMFEKQIFSVDALLFPDPQELLIYNFVQEARRNRVVFNF